MEEFAPKMGQVTVYQAEVEKPTSQLSPEIRATIKQAEVAGDPRFLNLIKAAALWQQTTKTVTMLTTEQEYVNGIEIFAKLKAALGEVESLRHEVVDFPTKFVDLVNAMFRPLRTNLENVKLHWSGLISAYDAKKRREVEEATKKAQEEAKSAPQQQQELPLGDGMARVEIGIQMPAQVPTTQVTQSGAKVTMRDSLEMIIGEPEDLLKAILSKTERNSVFTLDLISFNEPAIRKLCSGKRKIPGVKWEIVKKAV